MLTSILELAISLVFIYLSFSLVVSWVNEFITSRFSTRGKYLREQLSAALDDQFNKNWAELLYVHPSVDLLAKREQRPPAYIPGNLFATGLVDLIINEAKIVRYRQDKALNVILDERLPYALPIDNFKAGLSKLNKSDFTILMQSLLDNAGGDYEKLKLNIAQWYDDYMDRVSGWYKKKIRGWLFLISLGVAIAFNVDTIQVFTALSKSSVLRQSTVKAAEAYIADLEKANKNNIVAATDTSALTDSLKLRNASGLDTTQAKLKFSQLSQKVDSVYNAIKILQLPIGYNFTKRPGSSGDNTDQSTNIIAVISKIVAVIKDFLCDANWIIKQWCAQVNFSSIIGWLITAFALSYGAPFWFDILKKFVNVRSAGIKPAKVSSEEN